MNENINLVEILKDCPKGMKLYSTVLGDVIFKGINMSKDRPVRVENYAGVWGYTPEGRYFMDNDGISTGECTLFPSRDQRDWSKFELPDWSKFEPFQKVISRNGYTGHWKLDLFSHYEEGGDFPYKCVGGCYIYCLPYEGNEQLVGTTNNPEE